MSHTDIIYDSDPHFTISPITRQIKNESSSKTTLVQGDHKSERFSFEMPRIIEGHDMSECNRIEIHYINSGISGESHKGIYEANDMHIHPEDSEKVVFSWLLWDCVTKYEGKLAFAIRFACVVNDVVEYEWNTIPNDKIKISKGIDNSGETTEDEEIPDLIAQWKEELFTEHEEMKAQIAEFDEAKLDKSVVYDPEPVEGDPLEVPSVAYMQKKMNDEHSHLLDYVDEKIVTNYGEWFDNSDGTDFDTKVPSIGIFSDFVESSAHFINDENVIGEIKDDKEYAHNEIPSASAVITHVQNQLISETQSVLPEILEPNTGYNLGQIIDIDLNFPEEANDGDVIHIVFTAGTAGDTDIRVGIGGNNASGLNDFVAEAGVKYEIYGRYDGHDCEWLCGYSEY